MDWEDLEELIPTDAVPVDGALLVGGVDLGESEDITVSARYPGPRWGDTDPPGGDFEVHLVRKDTSVTEPIGYRSFFDVIESWAMVADDGQKLKFIDSLAAVTLDGEDPDDLDVLSGEDWILDPLVMLLAAQGIALAEHRRFGPAEPDGGGRRLLGELTLGLVLARWSAEEAAWAAASGHAGLGQLRSDKQHLGVLLQLPEYVSVLRDSGKLPRPKPSVARKGDEEPRLRADALRLLREMALGEVDFRPDQWEAIRDLVVDRKRLLLVQRTGWGKSAVYFIATRLLRRQGGGPAILISPLLSLMRNQVEMAERASIDAATINHANEEEHPSIYRRVTLDELDLLLVTPEWAAKPEFKASLLRRTEPPAMLVIDEVHCISDWGHDFRPDYRRLKELVEELPEDVPVLGTTATANKRVVLDVRAQLGDNFDIIRGSLARPGLHFSVFRHGGIAERLACLREVILRLGGSGIVYCLTIAHVDRVAKWLKDQGIDAIPYHASLDEQKRLEAEMALRDSDVDVVVSTSALGMGFDKPDIRFVIHLQSPLSIVEYYQEAGRAGRGIPQADAVLMSGPEEHAIHDWFLEEAFVTEDEAAEVLSAIPPHGAWSSELYLKLNLAQERIDRAVRMLEVEGAIQKNHVGRLSQIAGRWTYDHARPARVTAVRHLERDAIASYRESEGCRMSFLMRELDDPDPRDCGECDNCTSQRLSVLDEGFVEGVEEELRQVPIWIPPRNRVPSVGRRRGYYVGRNLTYEWGRALSLYGSDDLGRLVEAGRDRRNGFSDELVDAAVDLLHEWAPRVQPAWITHVPFDDDPELLEDFARRLAHALDLPFSPALRKTRVTERQKKWKNDVQRYRNVAFAFEPTGNHSLAPALVVDDYFESRWTFAVATMSLRKKGGVASVIPLALAKRVAYRGTSPASG